MIRTVLLFLALLGGAVSSDAGDVGLTIDGARFSAAEVTLKKGDRLVVTNRSQDNHFVWGHGTSYAFDFRATDSNAASHKPGDSLGITLNIPGRYRLGCALHGDMRAVVIVQE